MSADAWLVESDVLLRPSTDAVELEGFCTIGYGQAS